MATNPVVDLALQYRAAVLKRDATALARLTTAYRQIYERILIDLENLVNAIGDEELTAAQIVRKAQYKALMRNIEREVNQYGAFLTTEARMNAAELIAQAGRDARGLVAATSPQLAGMFNMLAPAQIETLLGFLRPDGNLFSYWTANKGAANVGRDTATAIAKLITEMIGAGKNPRTLAGALRTQMGMVLTSALRTARTVQLWSYREASRANYVANKNVVTGWQWVAELDGTTCPACVALHGTEYQLEVSTDMHWNCRCTLVPITILTDKSDIQNGEEWFKQQDEATQKQILGAGKYEAWKDGKFDFSQLAQHSDDATFGKMWTETPLKDLVPEEE
jgi:SPP1 gp7 family putative phage head morphogenesis protein